MSTTTAMIGFLIFAAIAAALMWIQTNRLKAEHADIDDQLAQGLRDFDEAMEAKAAKMKAFYEASTAAQLQSMRARSVAFVPPGIAAESSQTYAHEEEELSPSAISLSGGAGSQFNDPDTAITGLDPLDQVYGFYGGSELPQGFGHDV